MYRSGCTVCVCDGDVKENCYFSLSFHHVFIQYEAPAPMMMVMMVLHARVKVRAVQSECAPWWNRGNGASQPVSQSQFVSQHTSSQEVQVERRRGRPRRITGNNFPFETEWQKQKRQQQQLPLDILPIRSWTLTLSLTLRLLSSPVNIDLSTISPLFFLYSVPMLFEEDAAAASAALFEFAQRRQWVPSPAPTIPHTTHTHSHRLCLLN